MPNMLPVILKNLLTGVATRKYPAKNRELPEGIRGHIKFEESKCIFCGSCERKCPAKAIDVKIKKELTFYLDRCIMCGACVDSCAKKAISMSSEWSKPFYEKPILTFCAPPKQEVPKEDKQEKDNKAKESSKEEDSGEVKTKSE